MKRSNIAIIVAVAVVIVVCLAVTHLIDDRESEGLPLPSVITDEPFIDMTVDEAGQSFHSAAQA